MADKGMFHDFSQDLFRETVDKLVERGYLQKTEFCGIPIVAWPGIPDDEMHVVEPSGKRHVVKL